MSEELYLEFFGLQEAPFLLAPDPEFLYLSTQHSLAQAYLNYALLNRDSFVVITGDTGSGKTILINKLASEIGEHVVAAHIFQTQVTPVQFLQSVLLEFGFKPFDKKKVELLAMLNGFLVEQHEDRRQVLLIVDDAHNLSPRVLEEIRLISEVASEKGGILNVILCGQPGLLDTLSSPELEQLEQRIRFRFHIRALSQSETEEYITHRLARAGCGDAEIFAPGVFPLLYRYTGGVPRLINILCDTALTGAFAEDVQVVTERVLKSAVAELDWVPFAERQSLASGAKPTRAGAAPAEPAPRTEPAVAPEPSEEAEPADSSAGEDTHESGKLVLSLDGEALGEFALGNRRLMIGRDPDNDVQVAAEFVSRHHAQIHWARGACWVADLNSTNGTFVNGRRIQKRMLRDGDSIQLGRHRITYVNPNLPQEAVASEPLDRWRETTVLPLDSERRRKA